MTREEFKKYAQSKTKRLITSYKTQKEIHDVMKTLAERFASKLGKNNTVTKDELNKEFNKILKEKNL